MNANNIFANGLAKKRCITKIKNENRNFKYRNKL